MIPTTIPDTEIWEGATRRVFAAPNGDLTDDSIRPVEALIDAVGDGTARINVRCALEEGELEKLQAGGHVWISFLGGIFPFCVDVKGPGE